MTFLELEKECKRLKKRKFFILFLVSVFVGLISYLYYTNPPKKLLKNIETNKSATKETNSLLKVKVDLNTSQNNQTAKILPVISFDIKEVSKVASKKVVKHQIKTHENNKTTKSILNNLETKTIPSFEECIKKANYYYNSKQYREAFKWAKLANLQNKKDKRSWIIAAKALYKSGKKDKAIEILNIYYNFNHSKDIEELIKSFEKGSL